jgi:hypothetical protein
VTPAKSFRIPLVPRFLESLLRLFWQVSISLKFAVLVMIGLTGALIAATVMESIYDTPTAQYWVYQTAWFFTLLGLLFWLILAVALSRLPWQKRHLPFLCAHAGIMILLYGSWMTYEFGLDGNLQVTEGSTESAVELNEPMLLVASSDPGEAPFSKPLPWIPPNADFKPVSLPQFGIRVVDFLSHADSAVAFTPSTDPRDLSAPALKVKLAGGPSAPPFMRMGTEAWLWAGDRNWSRTQLGAATLSVMGRDTEDRPAVQGFLGTTAPEIVFRNVPAKKAGEKSAGTLEIGIQTSDGKRSVKTLAYAEPKELVGKVIATGWKFDATVTILEWIPRAVSDVSYVASRIQYGQSAPPSAILLEGELPATGEPGAKPPRIWLGLGERATFETGGKKLTIGYFPRRVILPFGIGLRKFEIARYQGTANPMEFSSVVDVKTGGVDAPGGPPPTDHRISMNEPMKYGGFTFYQSSYVDAQPRPVTSVFSVNQDPGRWLKYLGSFMIVLGSIWLFAMKYVTKRREAPAPAKG